MLRCFPRSDARETGGGGRQGVHGRVESWTREGEVDGRVRSRVPVAMKFSKELDALRQRQPEEWQDKFLSYKTLKKVLHPAGRVQSKPAELRKCRSWDPSLAREPLFEEPDESLISPQLKAMSKCDLALNHAEDLLAKIAVEEEFFQLLEQEMQKVSSHFDKHARHLHNEYYKLLQLKKKKFSCMKLFRKKKLAAKLQEEPMQCEELAEKLCEYAAVNSVALRKILKKYDKATGLRSGQKYLNRCHQGNKENCTFLHSPLRPELSGMAWHLRSGPHCIPRNKEVLEQLGTCAVNEDLTCPVCFDVLHRSVALGCGHVFCESCAIKSGGVPDWLTLKDVKPDRPCPLCRRTNVYPRSVHLRAVDDLVRHRFPEDVDRRQREWKKAKDDFITLMLLRYL